MKFAQRPALSTIDAGQRLPVTSKCSNARAVVIPYWVISAHKLHRVVDAALPHAPLIQPEHIEEDEEMYTVYKTLQDAPDWARECVNDLLTKGYLKGDGDGSLDLEHYMLRGLVINWRAGVYK